MSPHPRVQSKFYDVVIWGQDANVIILQPHGVYFVQSEMHFAAAYTILRNETKRNETKRNEIGSDEIKQKE